MKKNRFALMLGISVVVLLAFAGVAIGSNMGFKLNKSLVAGTANIVSIPYNNNFANATALLTDVDAISVSWAPTQLSRWNTATSTFQNQTYPTQCKTCTNFAISAGEAYDLRVPTADNWTVVGSHNPSTVVSLVGGVANYVSPPYHTTATNATALLTEIDNASGASAPTQLSRWNAATLTFQNQTYPTQCKTCTNFSITAGEGYDVRINAATSWTPAHY